MPEAIGVTMQWGRIMRALASSLFATVVLCWPLASGEARDATGSLRHAKAAKPIPIEYVPPTNPAHQEIYETLKSDRVLERFQEIFRIFPMAKPFGFKLAGCDGEANAWYDPDDRTITVCYEYVEEVSKFAPRKTTSAGVTPEDALAGPVIETFLHEAAHALFDVFHIPILGREEDAADQVAAFALLQLPDDMARRMIGGVAHNLSAEAKHDRRTRTKAYSDEHGLPEQRFYNLLCMAYGAKPEVFGDLVKQGHLPTDRAEGCDDEYEQVEYAVSTLLGPHMDEGTADDLKAKFKNWNPTLRLKLPRN
jgi:hypothetical protein